MLKTYTVSAVIVVIMLVAVIGIISCANEAEENISVSLVFIDEFTGDPIQGVEMFINGAFLTSGPDGKVTVSAEGTELKLEGYFDTYKLYELGYQFMDSVYYLYFSFTATSSFSRNIHCAQLPNGDDWISIAGVVHRKDGDGTVEDGYLLIFTPDGRAIRGFSSPVLFQGSYGAAVPEPGLYYFIVNDTISNQVYYTVKEVVEPPTNGINQLYQPEAAIGTGGYDLSYDGKDIVLQGNAGDADEVRPSLVLGEEIIGFYQYSDFSNPFSFSVPHRGDDRIRLLSVKYTEMENRHYNISPPPGYSADTSGIDAGFSSGSTVPDEWIADIQWDQESQTLSWNGAGNATAYIAFLSLGKVIKQSSDTISPLAEFGSGMFAFVQGTSVTFSESIDLSSVSYIWVYPVWAESFAGILEEYAEIDLLLLPADLLSGTVIFYEGLTDVWKQAPDKIIKEPIKEVTK